MIKERLSPSLGGRLLTLPIEKVVYDIQHPTSGSLAMHRGNRWEQLIHNPSAPRAIFEGTKTRGVKFDAWAKCQNVPEYMCETADEAIETDAFLTVARSHDFVMSLANAEYQTHLESKIDHCFTDFITKRGVIVEMKVLTKSHEFGNTAFRNNYDLQCYMQMMLSEFKYTFAWLVVDADAPYTIKVWKATPEVIESGRLKYLKARDQFDKMNRGEYGYLEELELEVPTWRLNQCL